MSKLHTYHIAVSVMEGCNPGYLIPRYTTSLVWKLRRGGKLRSRIFAQRVEEDVVDDLKGLEETTLEVGLVL